MKKILFISLGLIIYTSCFGQKCKFKELGISEVTGLQILRSKDKQIVYPGPINFYYSTNHCQIFFNIYFDIKILASEKSFSSKTPLLFCFDDSTKLTLYPPAEYMDDPLFNFSGLLSSERYTISYSITKEDIELLASKSLEQIRIYYEPSERVANKTDNSQVVSYYKKCKPKNNGKKHLKALSNCFINFECLSPDSCAKRIQLIESKKPEDRRLLEKVDSPGITLIEKHYNNFDEIQIGDIVKCTTTYDDSFYAVVSEKIKKTKIKVISYGKSGKELFDVLYYKKLIKIEIPD